MKILFILIENDYCPLGAGEPALSVVAPAIANAIAKAVGARVRGLPITPGRVKDALKYGDPYFLVF